MTKQYNTARKKEDHIGVQRLLTALVEITVLVFGAEITGFISLGNSRGQKMKSITTFERLMSTTADGELIKVTTIYSSFDKEEIDNLQADLQKSIGAGIKMIGGRE